MAKVKQQDRFAYKGLKAAARPIVGLDPDVDCGEEAEEEALSKTVRSPMFGRVSRVSARAGQQEKALLKSMPKEVSVDLKWMVWNEAWHVFNTCWKEAVPSANQREMACKAEEDASRSTKHLKAVRAAGTFSAEFLEALKSETATAAQESFGAFTQNSPLELPSADAYEDLDPPVGVTLDFWVRLVKVVHKAAVTLNEQAADTEHGDPMFREFEAAWELLSEVPPAPRSGVRHRLQVQPGRSRQAQPLAGMPALQKTPGTAAAQVYRSIAESEGSDVEDLAASNFAPALSEDHPPATGLCDSDGLPACVGSIGLWLESTDFVIACQEGLIPELGSAFDIGAHGSIREWPSIYTSEKNHMFKKMFGKNGPCHAGKVKGVLTPDVNVLLQMSGSSLQRLQSFANARAVKAKLGYAIVKGWAIYDLLSMEVGEGYLAERYWWNTTGEDGSKGWVDFTPRPEGMRELVLAQSAEELPPRRMSSLQPEQLELAESLLCMRCPEFVVARRAELGTRGAIAVALQHALQQAEARGDAAERRAMASACIRGVLLEHLSSEDENLPLMKELVSLLEVLSLVSQKDNVQEHELQSLVEAGGIEALTSLTPSEDTWIAATAASALACVCHGNPKVQYLARNAGAPRALARLFEREDIRRKDCYAAEAVEALWQAEGRLVERAWALPGQMKRESRSQDHWEQLLELCNSSLREEHRSLAPRARRGHSWGRVLAFAQVALGANGINIRRGTTNQPFVIWVLGAEDAVEGALAEEGFFDNANWVEQGPTEVIIFGEGLRQLRVEREPRAGEPAVVRTASYGEMPWLGHFSVPPPDLAAVLMPEVCMPLSREKPKCPVPELALAAVSQVPVVISRRFGPLPDDELNFRRKLQKTQIMKLVRCPFSTSGGSKESVYDDNGWVLAVQGQGALAKALTVEGAPEVVMPYVNQQHRRSSKQPVVFWGILDIKYDTARPVLDRVKVLETGDGQTSKFSHDGADIKHRFEANYQLDSNVNLDMQHVISADKKLTHDLLKKAEYGHVIPKQACFPRQYRPDLAKQVQEALGLTEDDKVVLKLCNRTRAAGVVISPVSELDDVLEDLLQPPSDLEGWFEDRLCAIMDVEGSPVELGLGTSNSFEEQRRHWWSNESPVFVAEVWCKSVPTLKEGQAFDGTMRVAFALRRRQTGAPASSPECVSDYQLLQTEPLEVAPETLALDWLGGYWKLPPSDLDSGSGSLRECVVSMAKTSGTAPVNATHLVEVFAALDDMVQQLYGRPEPSSAEIDFDYQHHPELGAFITARLGTWCHSRRPGFTKQMLNDADVILSRLPSSSGKSTVQAFIHRARGILELQQNTEGAQNAEDHFRTALRLLPTNANALHLIGLRAMIEQPCEAVKPLTQSLLLDPDYKGVYINLGLAYLRLSNWERCREVSLAGQSRHADAPQFHYHIAVSCCQMALAMVQECGALREELAEAKAAVEDFEVETAALEEALQKASDEVNTAKALMEEADTAKGEAKRARDSAEVEAKGRPVVAGTKLKAREDMVAIYANVESDTEIGHLRRGHLVTATGAPVHIQGYRFVPIEPKGAVELSSFTVAGEISKYEEVFEQAKVDSEKARKRWTEALEERKKAKAAFEQAAKQKEKVGRIPRRPVAKLLAPAQLPEYRHLRQVSIEAFIKVRESDLSKRRQKGMSSPWLEVDEDMIDAMESDEGPVWLKLPANIGWPSAQYRL